MENIRYNNSRVRPLVNDVKKAIGGDFCLEDAIEALGSEVQDLARRFLAGRGSRRCDGELSNKEVRDELLGSIVAQFVEVETVYETDGPDYILPVNPIVIESPRPRLPAEKNTSAATQKQEVILDGGWWTRAACVGYDPDIFFSDAKNVIKLAKEICSRCTVREECLGEALKQDDYGVRGGLTRPERAKMRPKLSPYRPR